MAYGADVPGLTRSLREEDLKESRNIYNRLPDDSQQPEVLESTICDLAALFVRHHAHRIFGIHLVHGHFVIPQNTALVGVTYETPHCRWAKTTSTETMDISSVHGHIFVLTEHGFHPYEYQTGPVPDLSGVSETFLLELANFLHNNNLAMLIGLQVIDPYSSQMSELVLPQGTIMLDVSELRGCTPTRQTGWTFEVESGEPRVCKSNETHARHANGHDIFNQGAPCPTLETFQDLKHALERENILR